MQMLPLTDPDYAWEDFQTTRLLELANTSLVIDPASVYQLFAGASGWPELNGSSCGASKGSTSPTQLTPPASPSLSDMLSSTTSALASPSTAASSVATSAPASTRPEVAGAVAGLSSPSTSSNDTSAVTSPLDKYGPVVIGLLAANLAVMLLLTSISLVACLRKRGPTSRSVSSSYAPVSFREKVDDDSESRVPVRNYGE